ncbi:hypothetical protein ALQ66_200084 [Pseudomonas savastanoi pv. glycinea]|nr:hypothetical protein ALQ66_200084 [Pseudomonas savastanoi pv. glycinea]
MLRQFDDQRCERAEDNQDGEIPLQSGRQRSIFNHHGVDKADFDSQHDRYQYLSQHKTRDGCNPAPEILFGLIKQQKGDEQRPYGHDSRCQNLQYKERGDGGQQERDASQYIKHHPLNTQPNISKTGVEDIEVHGSYQGV